MRYFTCFILTIVLSAGCTDRSPSRSAISAINSPAGAGSAEPHLAQGQDGKVVLNWLAREREGYALRYAELDGSTWGPAQTVARGKDWFVNWADFPSVTPVTQSLWAAHWLAKRPGGTYAYDVAIAISQDGGKSWSDSLTPHTDDTRTEHGFVSLFPWQAGVGALWLDGRNMVEDGQGAGEAHTRAGMTLRSAVITADGAIVSDQLVDDLVCDCCQTDVAVGADGPIAVYRNRTTEEHRDIYVSRAIDGRWEKGRPVANDNWKISGCPVNGPAIAADQANVAVAWFTAADDTSRVRIARSNDSAKSFSAAVDIDVDSPIGRVDIVLLKSGNAVVSWLRSGADRQSEFCLRQVSAAGELGPVHVIARTSETRSSSFPQMLRSGDDLVLAWTDYSADDVSTVRTAMFDVADL